MRTSWKFIALVSMLFLPAGLLWMGSGFAGLEDFISPGDSLNLAEYGFIGEADHDRSGYSIASAGDVDGDCRGDIIIGAPSNDDAYLLAGKTYLLLASQLESSGTIDLSTTVYSFTGEDSGNYSGYCVASAGDVDSDGNDDILIGAPYNDDGGSSAGKTYLLLSSTILTSSYPKDLSTADYCFIGEDDWDHSGYAVAGAGDVDGDGLDDILIGAPYNDEAGDGDGPVA